ncbi:MAG: hypothetical protein Q8T13_23730 [Acidobacteriota bacterium]|nr:hypothetical protein [Acidobacteriota bacterium]
MTWTPPTPWHVPKQWPGATCLVVCTGESAGPQVDLIRRFNGPVIAVKHGVVLRPDADVFFMSGEWTEEIAAGLLPRWTKRDAPGCHAIVRGRYCKGLDPVFKRVTRSKAHGTLSDLTDHVTGLDTGTSAINLAYHFGANTIVLVGYDMRGGHFCKHPLQFPPEDHFQRHMAVLPAMGADAAAKGVRIVNCSPISRVTCFERRPLEEFV